MTYLVREPVLQSVRVAGARRRAVDNLFVTKRPVVANGEAWLRAVRAVPPRLQRRTLSFEAGHISHV